VGCAKARGAVPNKQALEAACCLAAPLDDEKSIHHTVAQTKARQQRKPK